MEAFTMARFELGRLVATPAALFLLDGQDMHPLDLVTRHSDGDWGDLGQEDVDANEEAVTSGGRLLSRFRVGTRSVWVISESDRSATTVLLPEED
jgi:hypothetical protein